MRAHTHIGIHLAWSWRAWHWHTEIYSGVCTDVVWREVFTCTVLWKMSTWETSDIFITFKICREIYFSQRYFVILRRQEVATKKLLLFILFVGLVLLGPWGLLNLILNKYKTQGGNLPAVTWRPPPAVSEISLVWHLPWENYQAETQNQSRILCEASSRKILSSSFAHAIISIKTGT